jgi:murein DD-endopeptidase MepM/ murein hydrolase activator NlpD
MRFATLSLAAALLAGAAPPVLAADSGGASAPGANPAPGAVGGASTPPRGGAPVARLSVVSPMTTGRPQIRVRFSGAGNEGVTARVVVLRSPGNAVAGRIVLGSVPVGRTIAVPWRGRPLAAGEYVVRVHAHDRWNRQLRRLARASGKTTLVVKAKPAAPAPAPAAPADPVAAGPTAFPVAGPFTYGDGFGAARKGYSHQGQDMAAARGTPVVAPTSGTVTATDYQASAAGEYVVMAADNGYAYFYAHCIRGSTAVTAGQAVKAGGAICQVGSTGGSTSPHLHFEVWVGGWRVDAKSHPIDPLPLLKSWE